MKDFLKKSTFDSYKVSIGFFETGGVPSAPSLGTALQFASDRLRKNRRIAAESIVNFFGATQFVHPDLLRDEAFAVFIETQRSEEQRVTRLIK